MITKSDKSSFLLPVIAGSVAIVLGIAGVAGVMGWLPNSIGGFGNIFAVNVLAAASAKSNVKPVEMDLQQAPGNARKKQRCAECGVIVSMQEVAASGANVGLAAAEQGGASNDSGLSEAAATRFEFTVRLQGGAYRMIIAAKATSWRVGARVIIIDGTKPPPQ